MAQSDCTWDFHLPEGVSSSFLADSYSSLVFFFSSLVLNVILFSPLRHHPWAPVADFRLAPQHPLPPSPFYLGIHASKKAVLKSSMAHPEEPQPITVMPPPPPAAFPAFRRGYVISLDWWRVRSRLEASEKEFPTPEKIILLPWGTVRTICLSNSWSAFLGP